MLKVINVLEEGRFGGPQRRIIEVAKGLKKYGVETTVIFPQDDSEQFQKLLQEHNIDFLPIPLHRLTKNPKHLMKYVFYFFYEIFLLIRLLKKKKPDLVHTNGSWQVKGIIAAKISGVKSVWHLNDTFIPKIVWVIFKFIKHFFSDNFVAASQRTADYYFQKQRSIPILPAPVNTEHFSPDSVKAHIEISNLSGIKIVTVGNINPVKGYENLIEAARIVNEKYLGAIHFIAVGKLLENQTGYINNLKKLKEKYQLNNFYFWGASSDVKEILAASDIYVCSSHFESSPISVWEAMAMGKPIVSTDVGDVSNIFRKFKCGVVVPTNSPVQLAQAIIELIKNSNHLSVISKAARVTAVENFDINICIKKHFELYRKLIG